MKRILTIAVSLFVISASCFAQEAPAQKKHNGERAQAEKIGYITQRLQLTPEEAQVFWPVYNQYAAAAKEAKPNPRCSPQSGAAAQIPQTGTHLRDALRKDTP